MTIYTGDCVQVMAGMPADSVDAVVTDPPYALTTIGRTLQMSGESTDPRAGRIRSNVRRKAGGFMGKNWDAPEDGTPRGFQAWCEAWGREALRVTKPGGYLLAFGGTRTHHRLVCGLEDAGWIIRDELTWVYACLSDDTEILTDLGWVRYNSASDAKYAAAFDPATGELRWERIRKVHRYEHDGPMVEIGPSLVTLNHRVVIDEATGRVPRLPRLWDELPAGVGLGEAGPVASVLPTMQRQAAYPRSTVSAGARVERGATATAPREDDGLGESGLEGRSYRVQEARELLWGSIRARTGMGEADGPQGRVHYGAPSTARRALRLLARAFGVREPREPRPDRQPPREPDALAGQPDSQAVRVGQGDRRNGLPPGDTPRIVDFMGGFVWCITVPSGAFVARRNGVAFVTGNSGFPKGKANLKPAHEPIVLARKPGPLRALNIDATRIPGPSKEGSPQSGNGGGFRPGQGTGPRIRPTDQADPSGRWPSNLLLSDPELFDVANPGVVGSGRESSSDGGFAFKRGLHSRDYQAAQGYRPDGEPYANEEQYRERRTEVQGYGDSGGYSRFFIVPKSSRSDREPLIYPDGHDRTKRLSTHPTQKPTDLMRHLVRLVTPPGGLILDPFLGSGTTGIAAELEGFPWIGIEKEPEYVAIAEARLNGVQRGMGLAI